MVLRDSDSRNPISALVAPPTVRCSTSRSRRLKRSSGLCAAESRDGSSTTTLVIFWGAPVIRRCNYPKASNGRGASTYGRARPLPRVNQNVAPPFTAPSPQTRPS